MKQNQFRQPFPHPGIFAPQARMPEPESKQQMKTPCGAALKTHSVTLRLRASAPAGLQVDMQSAANAWVARTHRPRGTRTVPRAQDLLNYVTNL